MHDFSHGAFSEFAFSESTPSLCVHPAGIETSAAFGTAAIATGAVYLSPAAIPAVATFGATTVAVGDVLLAANSIGPAAAFGAPFLQPGAVLVFPQPTVSSEIVSDGLAVRILIRPGAGLFGLTPYDMLLDEGFF